jgi:hypothetical protein
MVLTATHAVERIQSIEQISGSLVEEAVEREGDVTESDTREPPFITDGRGRVVWTSPAEEDKTSQGENGEPASRPEAATGSGGLLGWFNALF